MTGFLYDGDCVIAEFDAQGIVKAQYIHGQGLGADVGSLICAQTLGADGATSERYYSHNWRGDTIGITDESGASLARYRYGAFGELIAGDGVIANNILFSGKRYDSASGLYYFGARYYDASSGRFVSRDPMGYIDGPNEYVLAMNNPLLWIDPWGLCRWSGDIRTAYHSSFNTSYGNPINPDFSQLPGEYTATVATVGTISAVSNRVINYIDDTITYWDKTIYNALANTRISYTSEIYAGIGSAFEFSTPIFEFGYNFSTGNKTTFYMDGSHSSDPDEKAEVFFGAFGVRATYDFYKSNDIIITHSGISYNYNNNSLEADFSVKGTSSGNVGGVSFKPQIMLPNSK